MDWFRMKHTMGLLLTRTAVKRAEYIKKHEIFNAIGSNCMFMPRKVPLYSKLISFGDNVWIASGVCFITHDVIHQMLNNKYHTNQFKELKGRIVIGSNVFIGANTTICPNITIGDNVVVAAGSLLSRDVLSNSVGGGYRLGI